nr:hypothetical protein [Tanacetum cinerariifolium]
MSDSEDSTVTYTEVSSLFKGLSDIVSPGVDGLHMMPQDPYAYVEAALQAPPSPDYDDVLLVEEQPLPTADSPTADSPGYIPESGPEKDLKDDPEEDDEDPQEDPADYPTDRDDDDDDNDDDEEEESYRDEADDKEEDEDEDEKEEEEHPAPADSISPAPVHYTTARISIPVQAHTPLWSEAKIDRLLAIPSPLASPLSPCYYDPVESQDTIYFPSTTIEYTTIMDTTTPTFTFTYIIITLILPFTSHRADVLEVTLPTRKRLCIALGPRYEVGESSSALTARPTGGFREDCGFVSTLDEEIRHDPERDSEIVGLWAADHTQQTQLAKALTLLRILQTQMVALQRWRGPARGLAHPRIPKENKMAPKRPTRLTPATTTTTTTTVTDAQLKALIDQGIANALAARDADRSQNSKESHDSGMDTKGVVELTQWFERMETLFYISNCTVENQIKFATRTLLKSSLTWWNCHVMTVGPDVAYAMTWTNLRKKMTNKYWLRGEIKKLKVELWNLNVKESDKIKRYIGGLPDMTHDSVMASKPKTMQDVIEFTTELMDKKINTFTERGVENKRKFKNTSKNNQNQQQNKRQKLLDLCNIVGHLARECRSTINVNITNNQRGTETRQKPTCFECGAQGHFNRECPNLKNNNRGNQAGNVNVLAKAYGVGHVGTNPNSNVVTDMFLLNNRYASILFDTGTDRSFVSTAFSSQIDITPTILVHYYDVELADERIIGFNTVRNKKITTTSSTEQPPLKDKSMCNKTTKDLWNALARHMLGSEYGEQDRKAAVLYEYEISKLLKENSNKQQLENTYTSQSANKKQEFVKIDNKKVEKKDDEKKRDMSRVKCYNCKKEGYFTKDCKKVKVKDYKYYKTKMLLAKKDKDEQVLLTEDQAWMESSDDSDQEINANMVFMAQIEKVLSDSEASSSSTDEKIFETSRRWIYNRVHMVTHESQRVNRYIWGLAPEIKPHVTSSEPATIQGTVSMANHLTTDGIKDGLFKKKENAGNKRRSNDQNRNQGRDDRNLRQRTRKSLALTTPEQRQRQRQYAGQHPKCAKCNFHHSSNYTICRRCNQVGHFTRYCIGRAADERPRSTCYKCGDPNHFRRNCPRMNQATTSGGNRLNHVIAIKGNTNQGNNKNQAYSRAFGLGVAESLEDPNVVTGTFSLNDHFATVLFDSGVDYSFISTNFLPLNNMKPSVISLGFEI